MAAPLLYEIESKFSAMSEGWFTSTDTAWDVVRKSVRHF
jgi:hypothetical protein